MLFTSDQYTVVSQSSRGGGYQCKPQPQPKLKTLPVQESACSVPTWRAEGRRGLLCEGELRTALATSSVSARGQAPAQTACLGPAGSARLPLGPSRKSQHDSKLPGAGERGASTPPRMCPQTHTHTHCSAHSLWTMRQPTPSFTWAYFGRKPS